MNARDDFFSFESAPQNSEPIPASVENPESAVKCQCGATTRANCAAKKFGIYGGRCIGKAPELAAVEPIEYATAATPYAEPIPEPKIEQVSLPGFPSDPVPHVAPPPEQTPDERLLMAESLQQQHPDVVRVGWRWNRYQHEVDYRGFRQNKLKPRDGAEIPEGVDNFGMSLRVDAGLTK